MAIALQATRKYIDQHVTISHISGRALAISTKGNVMRRKNLFFSSSAKQVAKPTTEKGWQIWFTNYVRYVGLNRLLKIELADISFSQKQITMRMHVDDLHMAATGQVHGGSMTTLADTSIGFGCYVFSPETSSSIAVTSSNIQFLHSTRPGDILFSQASLVHGGHSTQVWDAIVTSQITRKTMAVVRATALNRYENTASVSGSSNVNSKGKGGDSGTWIDAKLPKMGTNFNIDTMTKEEIASKFDKHAPHWEELVQKSTYKVLDWVTRQARSFTNKNARVLDAACAVGLISDCLRKGGLTGEMIGIDLSPKMVEMAQKRGNYQKAFVHDLEAPIPSPDRSFDLITCTGALELLQKPHLFLAETSRLLRDKNSEAWLTFQYLPSDGYHPTSHQNVRAHSKEEVEEMVKAAGLEVIEMEVIEECYRIPSPLMTGAMLPVPFIALRVKRRNT